MRNPKNRRLPRVVAVLALLALVAMTACNTFEGLGRDLRSLGDAISDKAEDAAD